MKVANDAVALGVIGLRYQGGHSRGTPHGVVAPLTPTTLDRSNVAEASCTGTMNARFWVPAEREILPACRAQESSL